jgi:hypothetical protein
MNGNWQEVSKYDWSKVKIYSNQSSHSARKPIGFIYVSMCILPPTATSKR